MSKVLVTGATGFVGKRLIQILLNQNHDVYAICRIKGTHVFSEEKPNLFYIWGDLRNPEIYFKIPEDIDAVYYLVHSMSEKGVTNLTDTEEHVALTFVQGIKKTKVRQIIYLGGIINDESLLSPHLRSRLQIERILMNSGIPATILRASLIIGSGSASFEIIRDLCEKLPIMIAPKWVKNACQPIGIRDVLFYLSGVLLNEACFNKILDIGGAEVLTFKELMQQYSSFRKLKTWIIDIPLLTPRLSSYWLYFVTSVRFSLCYYLVESMKSSTVVKIKDIQDILPHVCMTYEEALKLAFENIASNQVASTWMDSWILKDENPDIDKYLQMPSEGCLKDERRIPISASREAVVNRIWRIGGKTGYYALDWMWSLRGLMDKMVGGIGRNRGRRNIEDIQVGDSIDFWRVLLADKKKGHLVLFSDMRVPGEAWLVFQLVDNGPSIELMQLALFRPKGIWGRLYWYLLYPIHCILFKRMARAIANS